MSTDERLPRNGYSISAAAKKLGVSPSTVKRYTSEPRADYEQRAAERRARIRALRAEGLTMKAIAEREGVSVGTVHYALNKPERESAA